MITGIHHITAITSDAQKNIDFYTRLLGLRLTKITVNFDDPGSYHLYYGDETGSPGSALTYFVWPGAFRGRMGTQQVTWTSFSIPRGSTRFWMDRLKGMLSEAPVVETRFDEQVIRFVDFDGMGLELVESQRDDDRKPWVGSGVGDAHAIRGFFNATLTEEGYENTATLLTSLFQWQSVGNHGNRFRYAAPDGKPGNIVDVVCAPDARRGSLGAGIVHHIAFRVPDDPTHARCRQLVVNAGHNVSPIIDRTYFHSIYFREPGGVLFEVATDHPGFTVDETVEQLGSDLRLPKFLESMRAEIERALPVVRLPSGRSVGKRRIVDADAQ